MESIMWRGFVDFAEDQLCLAAREGELGIIYINVLPTTFTEVHYGRQMGKGLVDFVMEELQDIIVHENSRHVLNASSHYVWDDSFAVLVERFGPSAVGSFPEVAASIVNELERRISMKANRSILPYDVRLRVGTVTIAGEEWSQAGDKKRRLYEAFLCASREAKQFGGMVPYGDIVAFDQIVRNKQVTTLFQPIVELKTHHVYGWEALSRGPVTSRLHLPDPLFYTAQKVGALFALERVCRETGIARFAAEMRRNDDDECVEEPRLFINVHPQSIHDRQFVGGETLKMVQRHGLDPSQIVIEITEHEAIEDYPTFLNSIAHYRNQGYRIAIDDTGSGYAGLQTIVELMPDFIKLDMKMIRGVDTDARKQIMIEMMVSLGNNLGALIIAEGIETAEELAVIKELGVHYGQGFFLGRPQPSIKQATMY